jgi:5-methylcytosine-specific restriction endonuclease McrA
MSGPGRPRKYATHEEARAAQRSQGLEWVRREKSTLGPFAHWRTFWRSVGAQLRRQGVKEPTCLFRSKPPKRLRSMAPARAGLDIQKALAGRFHSMVRRAGYQLGYGLPEYRGHVLRILAESEYRCPYCGEQIQGAAFHVDHKIPLRRGGDDSLANLQPVCADCNSAKGNLTHEEFLIERGLKNGRKDTGEISGTTTSDRIVGTIVGARLDDSQNVQVSCSIPERFGGRAGSARRTSRSVGEPCRHRLFYCPECHE